MTFEINQIFEETYPPEAALWCMNNRAYIKEIDPETREEERQEPVTPAKLDAEGNEIKPAEYKTVKETVKVRRFQIVGIPDPTLSEVRAAALSRIDAATSSAILAGFTYEIEGEPLHFSYNSFDQQNFADTANGCLLLLTGAGAEALPSSVEWNGWRNPTEESKGELVRLLLDVPAFLQLYTAGALAHKATQMDIGGKRKEQVEACETVEQIADLLEAWGI